MIRDVKDFTPEFLTDVFRRSLEDQSLEVERVTVAPLSLKTAHSAQLHRLHLTYLNEGHSGPKSVIAKLPDLSPEMVENCRIFQPGTKEEWFYRFAAPAGSIRTPRVYFGSALRTTGEATLLLEDLGHLEAVTQVEEAPHDDIILALAELARFHAKWGNATGHEGFDELRDLVGDAAIGAARVQQLFVEAWPLFVKNSRFNIPKEVNQLGESLVEKGLSPEALSCSSPNTLLHGDYRIDNLLFSDVSGIRNCIVLDWESVEIGCGMIDVAWLVAGCVPNLSAELELSMLSHYYHCLLKHGVTGYDFQTCFDDYRKCMIVQFVQGVLSGTIYEPETVSDADARFATVIGSRFVEAAYRLRLQNLM
jgi:Ecdysteroid kinase-like family